VVEIRTIFFSAVKSVYVRENLILVNKSRLEKPAREQTANSIIELKAR
jgi:hypothetical protein